MVEVEVVVEVWGTYEKGDKIDMAKSTAEAIAKSGVIKIINEETRPASKKVVRK